MQNLNFDRQGQDYNYLSGDTLTNSIGKVKDDLKVEGSKLYECSSTLKKVKDQAKILKTSHNDVYNKLVTKSNSLFTRLVIWCSQHDKLHKILNNFNFFKKELAEINSLETSFNQLKAELATLKGVKQNLKKEQYSYNDHIGSLNFELLDLETQEMVYRLFGGKNNFDNLPLLDAKSLCEKKGISTEKLIRHIKYDDLSSPIMRGFDEKGHPFFAIKDDETKTASVYINDHHGVWKYIGENDTPEYFIIDTKVQDSSRMKSLEQLLHKHLS